MRRLILASGAEGTDAAAWTAAGIEVQSRADPAHEIVHELRGELAEAGARRATVHGVLLEVHGVGVLVEGAAGAGKGMLALDLLSRGHALVADDAVELARPAPGIVLGQAPPLLEGYLASRDLGVVDVRRLHGARALRRECRLDLVIRLESRPAKATAGQLLTGRRSTRRLLGESVPALALPAHSRFEKRGHNLAALVEAACLDRRLRLDGIEADAALVRRQARAIRRP